MVKYTIMLVNVTLVLFLLVISSVAGTSPALGGDCDTLNTKFDRGEVYRCLRSDGFSGVLNQKAELNKVGDVKVGSTCLSLFTYVYTSKSKGGPTGAQHMSKRLLILSNSHYLGMYSLDELPTGLTGNVLEFPGGKGEGNTIVFNSEIPPEKIYLGGEDRKLFK